MRAKLIVAAMLLASPVRAEIDNAKADKLFQEALALRESNPTAACAKFAEALAFNPQAIATRLNLAVCDEDQGRIASAVEKYSEVVDRARVQNLDDYRKEAEERLAKLAAEVPHVTLSFGAPPPDGIKVLVDDRVVAVGATPLRIAIDPGERRIVLSAPGRVTHVMTVSIAKRDDKPIALPALETAGSSRRTIGKITAIGGGVLFAGAVGIALVARGRYTSAKERCPANANGTLVCDDPADLRALDNAKTLGNAGTVVGVVGLVAGIAGGVLWWRSPSESSTGISRIDVLGGETTGLALHGRF